MQKGEKKSPKIPEILLYHSRGSMEKVSKNGQSIEYHSKCDGLSLDFLQSLTAQCFTLLVQPSSILNFARKNSSDFKGFFPLHSLARLKGNNSNPLAMTTIFVLTPSGTVTD